MIKTKRISLYLLISILIMSAIMLILIGNTYTNQVYAAFTRGELGGVELAQDAYSESSDSGGSWGEGDHTSYDGHIRFTYHNAASFLGYDLTSWTKNRVENISGSLINSVGDAVFRFTVFMKDKVSQISNHSTWGKGRVYFDLYENGTYKRSADVSCDMSNANTKYNDLYLGILNYGVEYRVDVSLKFGVTDGSSWGNYQGSWSYYFTLETRYDYRPQLYYDSDYVLRNNVYYFNDDYCLYWDEGYTAYRVGNIVYAMPSLNVYNNSSIYTKMQIIEDEGEHVFSLINCYGEEITTINTILDKTAPTGTLYDKNNNLISNYTNLDFYFLASDNVSGVDYCQYMPPNSNTWEEYKPGTIIPSTALNGTYSFKAVDVMGNYSITNIVLDSQNPILCVKDKNDNLINTNRVNLNEIKFCATDNLDLVLVIYVKKPDGLTDMCYVDGVSYYNEGLYSVYAMDLTGNISNTIEITIDRTPPNLKCEDTEFFKTYGKGFTVKAIDSSGTATIYAKTPDSNNYITTNSNVCFVFSDRPNGRYYFYAVDDVGNMSEEVWIDLDVQYPTFAVNWNDDNTFFVNWTGDYDVTINASKYEMNTIISGENSYTITAVNYYGFSTTETVIITHKYIETSRKDVTCTEQGYTVKKCITCDEISVTDYIKPLGHDFDSEIVPPTCIERGCTVNTCKRCGYSNITNYVNALGHSLTSQNIQPTCTENGCLKYSCERCDYFYETNIVTAMGHNYSQVTVEPTCTEIGGVKNYCTICDYYYMTEEIPAIGHNYETKVHIKATCQHEGERHFNCLNCGDFYSTVIPIVEHNYEMVSVETSDGTVRRTYECTHCNVNYIQEMGEQYDKVANYIEYLFEQYSPYMAWVFIATAGVWSLVMGIMMIIAHKNDDKEKAKKMLKNYFIGMIAIFVILMAAPLLVRGIAILVS